AKFIRVSPTKVRQVVDLIRWKDIQEARRILTFSPRAARVPVLKVLESAIANAENNFNLDPDELIVSKAYVDEGPTLKRWRPRARGRATRIPKRTCHITVIVSRMTDEELARRRSREGAAALERRRRRVGQQAAAERALTGRRRRAAGTPE